MASNTGRTLAGLGCLLWLGCVLLGVVMAVVSGMGILPDAIVGMMGIINGGSCCCASLGFVVGLVGIVMMFTGGGAEAD